jgi:hypothetical protein
MSTIAQPKGTFPYRVPTGVWLNEFTYQRDVNGKKYSTITKACELANASSGSMFRWADKKKKCRFLGRPIDTQLVIPVVNHCHSGQSKVTVYSDADSETIKNRKPLDLADPKPYRVDERGEWYSERPLGVKLSIEDPHRFVSYWKKKRSRLHDGWALRHEKTDNAVQQQGSPTDVTIYLLGDAKAIMAGEESRGKGHMSRINPELTMDMRDAEAKKLIRALLVKSGALRSQDIIACAKEHGIPYHQLYRIKEPLRIRSVWAGRGSTCWCLPGQAPPKNGRVNKPVWPEQAAKVESDGQPEQQANGIELPDGALPANTERTKPGSDRPENPKHLRWEKWKKEDKLSNEQISQRHYDETREDVSRQAVVNALSRLKQNRLKQNRSNMP